MRLLLIINKGTLINLRVQFSICHWALPVAITVRRMYWSLHVLFVIFSAEWASEDETNVKLATISDEMTAKREAAKAGPKRTRKRRPARKEAVGYEHGQDPDQEALTAFETQVMAEAE